MRYIAEKSGAVLDRATAGMVQLGGRGYRARCRVEPDGGIRRCQ